MATIPLSPFLCRALALDALSCLGMAALLVPGAGMLAPLLGLPRMLLLEAGLIVLLCAGIIGWLATRREAPRVLILVVIIGNVGWVAASLLLLVSGLVAPTTLGVVFVLAQAAAVAIFTELEWVGLRRSMLERRPIEWNASRSADRT